MDASTKSLILKYQRNEYRNPDVKPIMKEEKKINFTKQKRPELFPVKEYHSRPAYGEDINKNLKFTSMVTETAVSVYNFCITNLFFRPI